MNSWVITNWNKLTMNSGVIAYYKTLTMYSRVQQGPKSGVTDNTVRPESNCSWIVGTLHITRNSPWIVGWAMLAIDSVLLTIQYVRRTSGLCIVESRKNTAIAARRAIANNQKNLVSGSCIVGSRVFNQRIISHYTSYLN